MIYTSDLSDKSAAIKSRAAFIRRAAGTTRLLKPVIRAFDGKMYNCRFDEAIRTISDDTRRVSVYNRYGWLYIEYNKPGFYSDNITLLSGYSCKSADHIDRQQDDNAVIFDGKRINADKMCAGLDASRERLLKEAYELEEAADKLPETVQQIKETYDLLHRLTGSLPAVVLDVCKIKRHYY